MNETKQYTVHVEDEFTVTADSKDDAIHQVKNTFGQTPSTIKVIDSEKMEPLTGTVAKIKFYPQAWIKDYARETDAEGKQTWHIPIEDATDENGDLYPDNSSLSDRLARHERAPTWVQNWSGPFYVTIDEIIEL